MYADSEMTFFGRENLRNNPFQRGKMFFYLFIQKELLCSLWAFMNWATPKRVFFLRGILEINSRKTKKRKPNYKNKNHRVFVKALKFLVAAKFRGYLKMLKKLSKPKIWLSYERQKNLYLLFYYFFGCLFLSKYQRKYCMFGTKTAHFQFIQDLAHLN